MTAKRRSCLLATVIVAQSLSVAAEDVTFSTRHDSGRPESADFYYDGRAIGRGREGFLAIVHRIRELPAGSSVVWGPNYARCGSCSGSEPACVPKFLYPDLWAELVTLIKERRLTLSSDYPSAWPTAVDHLDSKELPTQIYSGAVPPGEKFDTTLSLTIGPRIKPRENSQPERTIAIGRRWYRLGAGERFITDEYDLELFLAKRKAESRLLIRIFFDKQFVLDDDRNSPEKLASEIWSLWRYHLSRPIKYGKIKAAIEAPVALVEPLKAHTAPLYIKWQNYHGPGTPHDEVLYELNGEYVGRGDRGFDTILARLKKSDPKTIVVVPRYKYSGRRAEGTDDVDDKNLQLGEAVPFIDRKTEFDDLLEEVGLETESDGIWPGELSTVLDWSGGDRSGVSFVSTGRIVRYDEQPSPPKVQLAWTNFKTDVRANEYEPRQPESEAVYTLDGKETGAGVAGFLEAMKTISKLPEKSVVHVRVCIRTKGPFTCPITFEGQRHFERTGFEPCFGMFPLLLDVARKKNLVLEWIPDEAKSCADCELNK